MKIERRYIVDEYDCKIAVQLDIETFERIEEVLENYALIQLMQQNKENNELLDISQAKTYYQTLEKAQ